MYCIIPLAGPDFVHPTLGIKPLFESGNQALISEILNSRSWVKSGELKSEKMIFVLRDISEAKECEEYLRQNFNGCVIVKISDFSKGDLMTSLAALSLIKNFDEPVICDLVDINFSFQHSVSAIFQDENIGAILPFFKSDDLAYSYAELDQNNYVSQTKEKKGWKFGKNETEFGNASAGVYFFRDVKIFLAAVIDSIENFQNYNHKENLFLCPAMNGVIKNNKKVLAVEVGDVDSVGLNFK